MIVAPKYSRDSSARESLIDRCDNWGAAMRGATGRASQSVASAEGAYRSPQPWHAVPTPMPAAVDRLDADIIEAAVAVLSLHDHALLRARHVHQLDQRACIAIARRAAGNGAPRRATFRGSMGMAYDALERALALPAVIRRDRARDRVRAILGAIAT